MPEALLRLEGSNTCTGLFNGCSLYDQLLLQNHFAHSFGQCTSSSNWPSSSTELFAALHLGTYRTSFSTSRRRGRLRSSTSSLLDVRPSRLVTVGDHSFATAGPRLWNSLPVDVQSAPSLTTFHHKLKTHLFRQSYPDIVLKLLHHSGP